VRLLLYSTDPCSLCERALDLLFSMPELRALTLDVVDVADDPALTDRYGPRIPVLMVGPVELGWPFDRASVLDALAAVRAARA
jgi:hypothetical protein